MTRTMPRRMVLRGLFNGVVISVGVPARNAMLNNNGTAYAAGAPLTKRYGGILCAHGFAYADYSMKAGSDFIPAKEGQGDGWSLPPRLASLAPVKDSICYINGMTSGVASHAHQFLTGYPAVCAGEGGPLTVPLTDDFKKQNYFPLYAAEPSIDQVIANAIGGSDPLRSLEVGVCHYTSATAPGIMANSMSYAKRGVHNLPVLDPRQVFNKVFGDFLPANASPAEKARAALRGSVLDVVREDLQTLRRICGPADCARLEQHATSLRELEKVLASPLVCDRVPPRPTNTYEKAGNDEAQIIYMNRAMGTLCAMAFACNRTRVFTNLFSKEGDGTLYHWLGADVGDHAITHTASKTLTPQQQRGLQFKSAQWRMERLSEFLQEFRKLPGYPGQTSLLDSCAILYTSATQGGFHLPLNMPVIIAGKLNGDMNTNFYHWSKIYDFGEGKTNFNRVLFTIMRLMGVKVNGVKINKFGPAPDYTADGRKVFYGYGEDYGGAKNYVVPVKDWPYQVTETLPALVAHDPA